MLPLANIGFPTIGAFWPASWWALPVVIVVEAVVGARVAGLPFRTTIYPSFAANAISTLVGIPLAWGVLFGLEMLMGFVGLIVAPDAGPPESLMGRLIVLGMTAPWLGPPVESWQVWTACAVLCVPFAFMSHAVERRMLRAYLNNDEHESTPDEVVRRWSRWGNALTYGIGVVGFVVAAIAYASGTV